MTVESFRDAMAAVCAPVAVITTVLDGSPLGATVSSLTSLSLRPPMILLSLQRETGVLQAVARSGRFGLNVLAYGQDRLAAAFARKGPDKFDGISWSLDDGLPLLSGVVAWITCDLDKAVEGGDHVVLFGRVCHARSSVSAPLIYAYRKYGTHSHFGDLAHADELPRARPAGSGPAAESDDR
jgi:flavin reductase (DIM6/NTAB) family NADH-FMN oxidoreductase RutF